jgi:outer membrane protein assembly factor BamB
MKTTAALVVLAVLAASATTQPPSPRLYTNPRLPPQEALDRLSLTLSWAIRLPTEGSQDGIFNLQLITTGDRQELLVQTRGGVVNLLDALTGDVLWSTTVGLRNQLMFAAGWNDENIYVTRHESLYVLDRRTGRQRLFDVAPVTGHIKYGFIMGSVPTAAPAADEDRVYVCLQHQVRAFLMPRFRLSEEETRPPPKRLPKPIPDADIGDRTKPPEPILKKSSPQPIRDWNHLTEGHTFLHPPVLALGLVNVLSADGMMLALDEDSGKAIHAFKLHGLVAAQMGHHGRFLYLPSEDHRVYAYDLATGRLQWRFMVGAPVVQQPWVTEHDMFVAAKGVGLYRVDRQLGDSLWLNRRAVSFLAHNSKFVYAQDRCGKLLILDYARGTTLSEYDMSEYPVVFSNELTDRIYMGAHDGTLLCLHHREHKSPFNVRARPKPGPKKDKGDEKKEEEKKEEIKKDKDDGKEKKDDKKKEDKEELKKKDDEKKKDDAKAKDADKAGRLEIGTRSPLPPQASPGRKHLCLAAARRVARFYEPRQNLELRRRSPPFLEAPL